MLEFGFQKSSNHCFQHLAIFVLSHTLTVLSAQLWLDFSLFRLRFRTSALNNICNWYLGLQSWFSNLALIRHGLEDKSSPKPVVRLGCGSLNKLNRLIQWPTGSDTARRVSAAMAARRRRSAQRGQGRPKRAFNTPAPARNAQRPHFTFSRLSFAVRSASSSRRAPTAPPSP